MTAIGHVSIFLSDKDKEQLVGGTNQDWLVQAVNYGDRALVLGLSYTGDRACGSCLHVCANLTGVNRFLAAGGKMKLNDSKSSVPNFLLSMKRKSVLHLSLPSPLPPSIQLSLTNINGALNTSHHAGR